MAYGEWLRAPARAEPPRAAIMLAVESLFLAGLGAGLASVAGVRAFVPLALFSLFARLGFIVEPDILGLQSGVVLAQIGRAHV